ncbi:hypothetical protein GCM10027089_42960 [Nocardia thraciensis]
MLNHARRYNPRLIKDSGLGNTPSGDRIQPNDASFQPLGGLLSVPLMLITTAGLTFESSWLTIPAQAMSSENWRRQTAGLPQQAETQPAVPQEHEPSRVWARSNA